MRIGMSLSSSHVVDDPRVGARWMIERARAADAAALDSLSLGDHHVRPTPYYQNTPMLGRLLAEWGPRPVGCLFLLPLWNPVMVAEHIGTLASLTSAPFIVQTGIGHGRDQFAAMNARLDTRGEVLEASISVVKAIIAGEEVESPMVGGPVTVGLRPHQPVEWWVGGGVARAIERAARVGDAWYAGPGLTPSSAPEPLRHYLDACGRHDVAPRPIVRKDVLVLADSGEANRLADRMVSRGYRGLGREAVVAGSAAEVAEQLAPFAELGFTDVICRCMATDQSQALETIALLADVRDLLTVRCGPGR